MTDPEDHRKRSRRVEFLIVIVAVVALAGVLAFLRWTPPDPTAREAGPGTGVAPGDTELGATGSANGSTSGGESTGTSATGTGIGFVVATSLAEGDPLVPGGPAQIIAFTVTNPGGARQMLTDVSVTIAGIRGEEWTSGGCTAADYTVGEPVIRNGEIAPAGVVTGSVEITMKNTSANQDACRNVVVPLRFVAG